MSFKRAPRVWHMNNQQVWDVAQEPPANWRASDFYRKKTGLQAAWNHREVRGTVNVTFTLIDPFADDFCVKDISVSLDPHFTNARGLYEVAETLRPLPQTIEMAMTKTSRDIEIHLTARIKKGVVISRNENIEVCEYASLTNEQIVIQSLKRIDATNKRILSFLRERFPPVAAKETEPTTPQTPTNTIFNPFKKMNAVDDDDTTDSDSDTDEDPAWVSAVNEYVNKKPLEVVD